MTNHYRVTGQYRQDIHAAVDADSPTEAVRAAEALFLEWLETMHEDVVGVTFGPDDAFLDDDVMVTQARDPSADDRSSWTQAEEYSLFDPSAGRSV